MVKSDHIRIKNKDEIVQRFALSAMRGELLEIEREKKREREIALGYYHSIVKIKREIAREIGKSLTKSGT